MPKEVIHDVAGQYDLVVGWGVGDQVQIGSETADNRPIVEHLKPTGEDDVLDRPLESTGLRGTYSRDGLNQLIRAARRARDATFGRDE